MEKKILQLLIHPLFIYAVIFSLECMPYKSNAPKIVLHEMPKVGDNFGVIDSDAVYYYSGKGKYAYPDLECYYSFGNPTFDVDYKHGGIKTIEKSIADRIPLLGNMCNKKQKAVEKKSAPTIWQKLTSRNYLLTNFSNISHVFFFFLLTFATLYHYRNRRHKYWFAFLSSFIGGALLEGIQYAFVYSRTASWSDQALNTLGAIMALFLFWIMDRRLRHK